MYLHRDDLHTILQFMEAFQNESGMSDMVEVVCESNEIGSVIHAILHGVNINGHRVDVTKNIVDESNW